MYRAHYQRACAPTLALAPWNTSSKRSRLGQDSLPIGARKSLFASCAALVPMPSSTIKLSRLVSSRLVSMAERQTLRLLFARKHLAWQGKLCRHMDARCPILTEYCRVIQVMYAFTIPHKAYAAGETIPVSVKFSPLAKNVRIVSLITTIREHTSVAADLTVPSPHR